MPASPAAAPVLTTPRLALRELATADAPFILKLVNEPDFIANVRDAGVRTIEDAERYIEGPRASYAIHGFGLWLAELLGSGEPAGICGLLRREGLDHPDLGFAFLERFRGRGYATEAASATLAHARDALGLDRVLAIVSPQNPASARVLAKLGMRDDGMVTLPNGQECRLWSWGACAATGDEAAPPAPPASAPASDLAADRRAAAVRSAPAEGR